MDIIKIAVAQVTPVFMDKSRTLIKALSVIEEAAKNGARLIAFSEAFMPGYPEWVWVYPAGKKPLMNLVYRDLLENSIKIPDDTTVALCKAAKDFGIYITMGISEINSEASHASLYNTQLYIDDKGNLLGKHRKLIPTSGERLVWTGGDGNTLNSYDTAIGRIGGLICWENYMPLARYVMYAAGVQVYIAPTWDYGDAWLTAMKHIAKEGGMFVLAPCMPLRVTDIPEKYEFRSMYDASREWINPGNSIIVNPKGEIIAGPMHREEGILYAELDFGLISDMKWSLDVTGHYARPDVFKFAVNRDENLIKGGE